MKLTIAREQEARKVMFAGTRWIFRTRFRLEIGPEEVSLLAKYNLRSSELFAPKYSGIEESVMKQVTDALDGFTLEDGDVAIAKGWEVDFVKACQSLKAKMDACEQHTGEQCLEF